MPYDWATGQQVATLPGFGPRTPNLVGVGAAVRPTPPIPGYDPHSPYGWSGYPVKPTPAPKATVTKKPVASTDPWALLLKQVQANYETPAQQEARVNREINAQMAAQQKVMDDEYAKQRADALASFQAQSLAGQAAAAMNKDLFASVGGEFNAAAGEMKGLAHGLSKNAQGATMGDVSAANAGLGALGNAPVMQGGTFGVGGGTQQGVEEYRGGTLAQQMFGAQGEAANFGLAGMIGAQGLQATQEAQAALIKTERDINDNHTKAIDSLNAGRLDLYHTYMSDAKDSQIKQISLMQGLIAAKQATAATNAKLKQQALRDMLAQANRDRTYGLQTTRVKLSAQNQAFNQGATKVRLNQGDTRIGLSKANLQLALEKEQRQVAKDALASGSVDVHRSQALGHVVDKAGNPITDSKGRWIPSSALSTAKGKTLTPLQMQNTQKRAEDMADKFYFGTTKDAKGKAIPATQSPDFNPDDPSTFGKITTPYTSALRQMIRSGIPQAVARQSLNARYIRGNAGRPYFSQTEKAAVYKKLGKAHYVGLLNTLHRFYTNYISEYQNGNQDNAKGWKHQFDQLVQGTLASVGMA